MFDTDVLKHLYDTATFVWQVLKRLYDTDVLKHLYDTATFVWQVLKRLYDTVRTETLV